MGAEMDTSPYSAYKLLLMSKDGNIESISSDLLFSF